MIDYVIASILAIIMGQTVNHLIRRIPLIIEEENAIKKFIPTIMQDFKLDIKYTCLMLIGFNAILYYTMPRFSSIHIYVNLCNACNCFCYRL